MSPSTMIVSLVENVMVFLHQSCPETEIFIWINANCEAIIANCYEILCIFTERFQIDRFTQWRWISENNTQSRLTTNQRLIEIHSTYPSRTKLMKNVRVVSTMRVSTDFGVNLLYSSSGIIGVLNKYGKSSM